MLPDAGFTVGAAMVSEKHCNFLINTGDAIADEIETLGETAAVSPRTAASICAGKSAVSATNRLGKQGRAE